MPMTFPAHQGLILPVVRRWPNSFDALALSVGAAMPDITDTVLGFLINGYFKQWYGHALIGIFTLDLAGGLLITWLIVNIARRLFKGADLPQYLRPFFTKALSNRDTANSGNPVQLGLWSVSVLVGILSHVAFDLISHATNLLLYPWSEDIRWFPGWWYATWFEMRPLPIFGHVYSVGFHSIIWFLLTVMGIFFFLQFISPKREDRVSSRES
jgi:hypothetical protein